MTWDLVLASLVGLPGDFDRVEDAAQEAFPIAAVADLRARTALTWLSPARVLVRRPGVRDNLSHRPRELPRRSAGIQVSLRCSPAEGPTTARAA